MVSVRHDLYWLAREFFLAALFTLAMYCGSAQSSDNRRSPGTAHEQQLLPGSQGVRNFSISTTLPMSL